MLHNLDGVGYADNPFANKPESYRTLAGQMSSAWINFIANMDPNSIGEKKVDIGVDKWPVYNITEGGGVGNLAYFNANGSFVRLDTYRAEALNWLIEHSLDVLAT